MRLLISIHSNRVTLSIARTTSTLTFIILRATRAIGGLITMADLLRRGIMSLIDGQGIRCFKKEASKRTVLLGLVLKCRIRDLTKLKVIGTAEGNSMHKDD
jgi:hypothetical protein